MWKIKSPVEDNMLFEKIKNADLILTLQFIHNKSWQGKRVLISIFPGGSNDKESICNAGDWGSIPGLEDSPGEGNGYPLQYSCLETSWTKEQGGLQSVGLQRVGHNWETIMNNHQPKKKKKDRFQRQNNCLKQQKALHSSLKKRYPDFNRDSLRMVRFRCFWFSLLQFSRPSKILQRS